MGHVILILADPEKNGCSFEIINLIFVCLFEFKMDQITKLSFLNFGHNTET